MLLYSRQCSVYIITYRVCISVVVCVGKLTAVCIVFCILHEYSLTKSQCACNTVVRLVVLPMIFGKIHVCDCLICISPIVLTASFPGEPESAGFIDAKDDGSGGDSWSYKVVQSFSQIVTTNKPTPNFLQAGCPSCRPTNSVKALTGMIAKLFNLYLPSLHFNGYFSR